MKYRKKPVEIEAWQFTKENGNRLLHELQEQQMNICPSFDDSGNPVIRIPTLEGEMTASIGDYIIKGIKGEFYPCKPDIFEASYDEADEEPKGDFKNRYGKLCLPIGFIEGVENRKSLPALFSKFVPVMAYSDYYRRLIVYYGFSDEFDVSDICEEPPEYMADMDKSGKVSFIKFENKR